MRERILNRFEDRKIELQNYLPETFCPEEEGKRKVVNTKDAVLNVQCPICIEAHHPEASEWNKKEQTHYK